MSRSVEEAIKNLSFGDRLDVWWYDASEATGMPPKTAVETYIHSTGFFLGTKGRKRKHLVLAKEIIDSGAAYHYNVILFEMIDRIVVVEHDVLDPTLKKKLKKFVQESIHQLTKKDGWCYAGHLKKRLKKVAGSNPAEKKPKKVTQAERIHRLEVQIAVLEEQLKHRQFLEKIIWVLLATSLGEVVLRVLGVLG